MTLAPSCVVITMLLGRLNSWNHCLVLEGTGPNEHVGNIRYRALVRKVMEEGGTNYNHLNSSKKRDLAKEVVASVKAMGGRFMKHATRDKNITGRGTNKFLEVPDSVAIDKVKQGFRHQIKQAKSFNMKDIKKNTTAMTSREMTMSKGVAQNKAKHRQRLSIVMDMAKSTRKDATSTTSIIMDSSNMSLSDQERVLPIDQGETLDSSPSVCKGDSAICRRPDSGIEGSTLAAPSSMLNACPLTTMKSLGQREYLNKRLGHLDRLIHGFPTSTFLYSDRRSWLDPMTTIVPPTIMMPPPFYLRRSPPSLPPQPPFFGQFPPFTGGTGYSTGLEWDPGVLHLLALRLERPKPGFDFSRSACKEG